MSPVRNGYSDIYVVCMTYMSVKLTQLLLTLGTCCFTSKRVRKMQFYEQSTWNSLSDYMVSADVVIIFKTRL